MAKLTKRALACWALLGVYVTCSGSVLLLSSDTTWTDLSALNGYDGVEIANGRTLTLNPASGTTMNFNKPISGAGGVVKDGAGTLELRAANTFSGLFIIGGTGDVYAYTDAAFGSSAGRTTLYEHLYTGGVKDTSADGANLYLCGITTDEGFDLVSNTGAKYLYAQASTDNTINGSVTVNGGQTSVYALSGATLRFRGGISVAGSGSLRPSAASNGKVIVENNPMSAGMWNAIKGDGCLVLSAPGNSCGYTFLPIVLDCDWAFNGASVNWQTGSLHMKVDLNGHANRVAGINVTNSDSFMTGEV